MANKVRYLTISRVAVELVKSLSDKENKQFNQIVFSCFEQLENGQKPEYKETGSAVLNIALREAVAELETGYKNYTQRVNARKKASSETEEESTVNQRSIADKSPIDHRPTIEEKRIEEKKREERGLEGMQGETLETQQEMLLAWAKNSLSLDEYQKLEEYLSNGGDTEKARLAIHKWKNNGKRGFFMNYVERG